jgi:hypothetical protein
MRLLMILLVGCTTEAPKVGLSASDSRARACEVLLRGHAGGVTFDDSLNGRWLRQGEHVAAAFSARSDAPIGGVWVGGSGDFEIVRSHCYGSDGVELAGVTVRR